MRRRKDIKVSTPVLRRFRRVGVAIGVLALVTASCGTPSGANPARAGSVSASSGSQPLRYIETDTWGTSWSYNPLSPSFPPFADDFVYLPLALQVPPGVADFSPQLARSWSVEGRRLVVRLRPHLKWQNGEALTSTDVYDTALEDGLNGTVMNDVSGLSTPSPDVIAFTIRRGIPLSLAEADVLGILPAPSSLFAKFLPRGVLSDELKYYAEAARNPGQAQTLPSYKTMENAFTHLVDFKPRLMIGDGPFRLESITTDEARLLTWKGFYDARTIHIGGIDFLASLGSSSQAYGWLFGGEADYLAGASMPPPIAARWAKQADHRSSFAPAFEVEMAINDRRYPLNLMKVRQAIAYVVPRRAGIEAAYGKQAMSIRMVDHPDGLMPESSTTYLASSQARALNTYSVDDAKAAALLKAAGFHRAGGRWIMPNGRPFTIDLSDDAAQTDVTETFRTAADALTAFGIKSLVTGLSQAAWESDFQTGSFQVTDWLVGGPDPLNELSGILGSGSNFASKGHDGLGFGPVEDVPGLGRVNVPQTLSQEAQAVAPGSRMRQLTWDWARFVNDQLPYLELEIYVFDNRFTTRSFVHWPPANSPLWNIMTYNVNGAFLTILEHGYVLPRKNG